MAREILFRGFNAESKQWIHGNLISGDYFFILSDIKESEEKVRFTYFKVIPDSIGQFTGLTDKNGVKIFEGDIVDWGGRLAVCVFEKGKFLFKNKNNQIFDCYVECAMCQVIGNIFENPELLEPENKKAA